MKKTKIEWCDVTINPVVGCTYGCQYCYARRINQRFGDIQDFSKPQFFSERLKQLESKTPKIVFMNSMSDIADWKEEWIKEVFQAVELNPQHQYLFLTKRPQSYIQFFHRGSLFESPNVWLGSTITKSTDDFLWIDGLQFKTFVSIEPILDSFENGYFESFGKPHWVIIGAETGNRKGKVIPKKEWITDIIKQCDALNIPVFLKNSLLPIIGESKMRYDKPDFGAVTQKYNR